jgi:hypothetical protein
MRYLIIALILICVSPVNAGIVPIASDEYCEPIREFTWNIRDRVIHPIRAALLDDKDLACFPQWVHEVVAEPRTWQDFKECVIESSNYCLHHYYYLQR